MPAEVRESDQGTNERGSPRAVAMKMHLTRARKNARPRRGKL